MLRSSSVKRRWKEFQASVSQDFTLPKALPVQQTSLHKCKGTKAVVFPEDAEKSQTVTRTAGNLLPLLYRKHHNILHFCVVSQFYSSRQQGSSTCLFQHTHTQKKIITCLTTSAGRHIQNTVFKESIQHLRTPHTQVITSLKCFHQAGTTKLTKHAQIYLSTPVAALN